MPLPTVFSTATVSLLLLAAASAQATELVYRPLNPSFGGNPLLSGHYLALATAQKKPDDRGSFGSSGSSEGEQFVRQLQSRLLSSLASQVNDAIFGDNPQESGTIVFGEQTISFNRGLEFITIDILNTATGQTTQIQVPVLQVSTGP
ncbi:MAG: curli assembly protein CsgF [Stagnimonas sp.]|nr:curli assembly protein CsgF [Stagnimonas sp.]